LSKPKSTKPSGARWVIVIVGWTFVISVALSFLSDRAMTLVGAAPALLILLLFIALGIAFDVLGLAAATAQEAPFHSMASRRVKGAAEGLRLVRNADRVSNFCNDVVGDISGIISGSVAAVLVTRLAGGDEMADVLLTLLVTGLLSALTVGGKALGKSFALRQNTRIVLFAGKLIHTLGGRNAA
jgi:hypothetical protein